MLLGFVVQLSSCLFNLLVGTQMQLERKQPSVARSDPGSADQCSRSKYGFTESKEDRGAC